MADETAYDAKRRREALAEECLMVMLDSIKAFFCGNAALQVGTRYGTRYIRFHKDNENLLKEK